MQVASKIILWLAFILGCFLPTSALTPSAPENRTWEIFSIGYDEAMTEGTGLGNRTETSTSDYDTAPIQSATTEEIPTEANRTLFGQNAEFKAAEEAGALPKCFAAGTKVSTPDGEKKIEDIKKGDTVYAYDFDSKQVVERKVLDTVQNFTYHWADIQVGNETIRATRAHKFWVESEKQWIEAAQLKPGMTVRLEDGHTELIKAVRVRDLIKPDATYNLIVQHDHDYFVGQHEVLVHNGYPESPQYPPATQVGENFQFNFGGRKTGTGTRRP
jgi:hypothetical protein